MAKALQKLIIGDGNEKPLPLTRKKQIKELLRDHYGSLIVLSILSFLFITPSIVVCIVMSFNQAQALKDNAENMNQLILATNLSTLLYLIPCVILIGISLAGLFNFIKRLIWNERVTIRDYFLGIKDNWYKFILICLFEYIFVFMLVISISYYGFNSNLNSLVKYGIISITGIVTFIVTMITFYMMSVVTRYKTTLSQLFSNCFKLTFATLPRTFLITLLVLLPWVINLLIPTYFQIIIFVIEMVFVLSLSVLVIEEYHAHYFDEFVNKDNYPEIYRNGLQK